MQNARNLFFNLILHVTLLRFTIMMLSNFFVSCIYRGSKIFLMDSRAGGQLPLPGGLLFRVPEDETPLLSVPWENTSGGSGRG